MQVTGSLILSHEMGHKKDGGSGSSSAGCICPQTAIKKGPPAPSGVARAARRRTARVGAAFFTFTTEQRNVCNV